MSTTGPGEGTLRLFPDVLLSNSYLLLRPFFEPIAPLSTFLPTPSPSPSSDQVEGARQKYLGPSNWAFTTSSPSFPGIKPESIEVYEPSPSDPKVLEKKQKVCFSGQRLSEESHPHLRLDREDSMISIPKVEPGDMVFWHCDEIHSVEDIHTGKGDSSGMSRSFLTMRSCFQLMDLIASHLHPRNPPNHPKHILHSPPTRLVPPRSPRT